MPTLGISEINGRRDRICASQTGAVNFVLTLLSLAVLDVKRQGVHWRAGILVLLDLVTLNAKQRSWWEVISNSLVELVGIEVTKILLD